MRLLHFTVSGVEGLHGVVRGYEMMYRVFWIWDRDSGFRSARGLEPRGFWSFGACRGVAGEKQISGCCLQVCEA